MRLDYFQLREDPFGNTPDPNYLFEAESHSEAAAALIVNAEAGVKLQVLVSSPGVGKTTLLRSMAEYSQRNGRTIFVQFPNLPGEEFLRLLCDEVGIPASDANSDSMLQALSTYFQTEEMTPSMIIIDEGQDLDPSSLRMLESLLYRADGKLRAVLAGTPELLGKLRPVFARTRSHKVVDLSPLESHEVPGYLGRRLALAGYAGPTLFASDAAEWIARESGGVPRTVNSLASAALLYAARRGDTLITASALRAMRGGPQESHSPVTIRDVPSRAAADSRTDEFSRALSSWFLRNASVWTGTAGELSAELSSNQAAPLALTPKELISKVEQNSEALRACGVNAEVRVTSGSLRLISLRSIGSQPAPPAQHQRQRIVDAPRDSTKAAIPLRSGLTRDNRPSPEQIDPLQPTFTPAELAKVDELLRQFCDNDSPEPGTQETEEEERSSAKPKLDTTITLTDERPAENANSASLRVAIPAPPTRKALEPELAPVRNVEAAPPRQLPPRVERVQAVPQVTRNLAHAAAPARVLEPVPPLKLVERPVARQPIAPDLKPKATLSLRLTLCLLAFVLLAAAAVRINQLTARGSANSTPNPSIPASPQEPPRKLRQVPATEVLASAKRGDSEAQYELGMRYAAGLGIKQDKAASLKWLRKSAEWGHPQAQYQLGRLLSVQSPTDAYIWLAMADHNGDPRARDAMNEIASKLTQEQVASSRFRLGQMFFDGLGASRDYPSAYVWFRLAQSSGSKDAMERLLVLRTRMKQTEIAQAEQQSRQYR